MNILWVGLIILVIIVIVMYRRRESFINYYGYDSNITDKICPSPWCGSGPVTRAPEDSMYPSLITDTAPRLSAMNSEAAQVAQMAGYDLLDDGLYTPSDDNKAILDKWARSQDAKDTTPKAGVKEAYGMAPKERFSMPGDDVWSIFVNDRHSDGADNLAFVVENDNGMTGGYVGGRRGIEDFNTEAPAARDFSYAGRYEYEHPDMDGFRETYYSNPSRTLGVAQQSITHFNEGVAYQGRPQEMLAPSRDAYPYLGQGVPYGKAGEFFDLSERFSNHLIEDPRDVTVPANGIYKSRMDINDAIDLEDRRRKQITLDSAQRGDRFSNKARAILSTVYSPEMFDATQSRWWDQYEP